ncbi:hypothetical protein ScPMuIL_015990 [Solemya velum]
MAWPHVVRPIKAHRNRKKHFSSPIQLGPQQITIDSYGKAAEPKRTLIIQHCASPRQTPLSCAAFHYTPSCVGYLPTPCAGLHPHHHPMLPRHPTRTTMDRRASLREPVQSKQDAQDY